MLKSKIYKAIGVMSGTSIDGLDIAYCFFQKEYSWSFKIIHAETIVFDGFWKERLNNLIHANALELVTADRNFGHFIGKKVNDFIIRHAIKADFISSHGHTVFHQPDKKVTVQIGHGAAIAAETNLSVICDFRSFDVALGGQGAPLVPIGDDLLFSDVDYCLNLGGFANISYKKNGKRIAYDICPVNIVLNYLSQLVGKSFDESGQMGKNGKVDGKLLTALNELDFYKKLPPKSLGKEWVLYYVQPLLENSKLSIQDKLRTFYEHIAIQIKACIIEDEEKSMLITGGGAHNNFLTERIKALCRQKIIIPDKKLIDFKEALIFAFLGVLRMFNQINCLSSVTGAEKNNIGGCIYGNFQHVLK